MTTNSRPRTIPPNIFQDENLLELPPLTRLLALSLPFHVDDWGRGTARPALVKANLFPLDETFTTDLIEFQLLELEDAGYLRLYLTADGRQLLELLVWSRVDRPKDSDFPPPTDSAPPLPPLSDAPQGVSPCQSHARGLREDVARITREPREDYAVGERESLREREEERVSEQESERERGSVESGEPERTESERVRGVLTPPSPFCKDHQPYGTEAKCGPCLRARLKQEAWTKDHPDLVPA